MTLRLLPQLFLTAPFAALVPAPAAAQEEILTRDPVRNYLADFETQPGEQLISTRLDLNGDGVDEVFLSRTSLSNGRQGNIWVLYESRPDGFWRRHDELSRRADEGTAEGEPGSGPVEDAGGVIEFHPKAVTFVPDGKGGASLLAYSAGSASAGRLFSLRLLGEGGVSETVQRGIFAGGGSDQARYDELFPRENPKLAFTYQDMDELRARHLPFGGWFRRITAGKLIFLFLCVLIPWWFLRSVFRTFFRRKPPRPAR